MITLLMHFLRESNYILVCRPVAALLDITVLKVDKKLKDRVQEDVVQEQGPTDGTVIVSSIDNSMLSDSSADQVMELFAEIGEIILVRLVLMAFLSHHSPQISRILEYLIKLEKSSFFVATELGRQFTVTIQQQFDIVGVAIFFTLVFTFCHRFVEHEIFLTYTTGKLAISAVERFNNHQVCVYTCHYWSTLRSMKCLLSLTLTSIIVGMHWKCCFYFLISHTWPR